MEKNLIILNHLHVLPSLIEEYSRVKYAPVVKSNPQKKWFEKRFEQIKKKFPNVEYSPLSSLKGVKEEIRTEPTDLLGEACFEEQSLGINILNFNNRLFDRPPLENIPDGFTSFRKKVEPLLPDYFQEDFSPVDGCVVDKVNSYFNNVERVKSYFETRKDRKSVV